MNKSLQMIVVLVIVGLFSGAVLVGVYQYAQPRVEENIKKAKEAAIYKILPEAKSYAVIEVGDKTIYQTKDATGQITGYAFVAEGTGYQGAIKIMIGLDPDLQTVKGIDILDSKETPGLGARIQEAAFKEQFEGLSILPEIALLKNKPPQKPNEVQAITGATISSRSVVRILNKEIAVLRERLKSE